MLCYRVEHSLSGLGPFEHGNQYASIVNSLISHSDPDKFKEQFLLHTPEHVFGWDSLDKLLSFIKPHREGLFVRYKFTRNVYEVADNLVIHYPDGQVSFKKKDGLLVNSIPFLTKKQKNNLYIKSIKI